ncbi:MAG: nuclear transport factor 2 family protein [Alphaproteobacteria bacterium]|nr:nuclear transport factor 2 family protein [Alphaproteobacteria bacterium]MBL6937238.1 nuclear transport factor 2 family protein [Alphaproteobacteria bacterium]MBL7096200.1 nuclear transport factor 2 family protein [Alphaproteobacteria bacterium]
MTAISMSRRLLFGVGTSALAAVASIPAIAGLKPGNGSGLQTEAIIRKHYKAWENKDWPTENALLADNFTFSSAAGDARISKSVFKTRCWDNNVNDIRRFDLLRLFPSGDEAFVLYNCVTMNNKNIRNVEYFQVRDGRITDLECYFGAPSNYPAAVSARGG